MAVLPRSSTSLDLTISIPGFASSTSPAGGGGGGGGGGGNITLKDFDINQVPAGGEEEEWVTGSMELEGEEDDDGSPTAANVHHGGGSGGPPPKKLRLTKLQSRLLEESFRQHHTLNPKQKEALAMQLTLKPRQVEVWFQNRRARSKLKQTEMECEYLKRWFGSLTEQNRKLHKEVEELRAMKVSPPTVLSPHNSEPLPASTLSMCPRCERVTTTGTTKTTTSTTNTSVTLSSISRRHPSAAC